MAEKLAAAECIAVESILAPNQNDPDPITDGTYRLRSFTEDVDYCVRATEAWIWSIGKRLSDGAIFAATDGRFYQLPGWDCLWLR